MVLRFSEFSRRTILVAALLLQVARPGGAQQQTSPVDPPPQVLARPEFLIPSGDDRQRIIEEARRLLEPGHRPRLEGIQGQNAPPSRGPAPRFELFAGYLYSPELDEYKVGSEAGHGWAVALNVNLRRHLGVAIDVDGQSWTVRGDLDSVDLRTFQCTQVGYGCGLRGDERISLNYVAVGPRFHISPGRMTLFALADVEVQRSSYSEQDLARVGRADDAEFVRSISVRPQNIGYTRPYLFDTWDRPLEYYGVNVVGRARMGKSSASAWGFGFGGGTDFSITRRISIRLVQVNYSLGGYGQGPGRQLRIKTGVVFKFG